MFKNVFAVVQNEYWLTSCIGKLKKHRSLHSLNTHIYIYEIKLYPHARINNLVYLSFLFGAFHGFILSQTLNCTLLSPTCILSVMCDSAWSASLCFSASSKLCSPAFLFNSSTSCLASFNLETPAWQKQVIQWEYIWGMNVKGI